ncbi:MAG: kelch repeat-containing protein [Planctomycetota bacterium]
MAHAIAFDSTRARTVLFGGASGFFSPSFADTWELINGAWVNVSPTAGPAARSGHRMVFDSQRQRIVLFGGALNTSSGALAGDTWEWDGVTWTEVAATGFGPSPRAGHFMAYDSHRDRTVLYGGSAAYDTWEWNGTVWTSLSYYWPPNFGAGGMAYDSLRQRTVMYGGSPALPNATWEWNGPPWTLINSGPPVPSGGSMAFDSTRGKIVMCGRNGSTGSFETWEFTGGPSWVQTSFVGPALTFNAVAFDSVHKRLVLLGSNSPQFGCETWELIDPVGAAAAFGTGCGSPVFTIAPELAAPPTIGTTAQALLTNAPSPLTFVAIGWSNTSAGPFQLPIPLIGYGMPGCYLLQSTEVLGEPTTTTGPGTATYALPVPLLASLIERHIYLQGWTVAPGANPAGIIVSNGLDWHIGY